MFVPESKTQASLYTDDIRKQLMARETIPITTRIILTMNFYSVHKSTIPQIILLPDIYAPENKPIKKGY